jgi:ribonuclease P protein component
MLPAKHRLTRRYHFKKVNRLGRTFYTGGLRLKLIPNNLEFSRLAVVVGTRVSKKATRRNRLRRQLREIIRLQLGQIKSGYDLIFLTLPTSLNYSYQKLRQEVLILLTQAKVLK